VRQISQFPGVPGAIRTHDLPLRSAARSFLVSFGRVGSRVEVTGIVRAFGHPVKGAVRAIWSRAATLAPRWHHDAPIPPTHAPAR
jgi:hypothetical protein